MVRKWMAALTVLLCLAVLVMPVHGQSVAKSIQSAVSVDGDGVCQVSLTVSIRVEEPQESLVFPLPGAARDITVNGAAVRTSRSGNVREVDLRKLFGAGPWEAAINFHYVIPNCVTMDEEEQLTLDVPILCGFVFPVESMNFTVSLPGEISADPMFLSGYYQQSIESSMDILVSGNQITGMMKARLLDRETLRLTMPVPAEQFPGIREEKSYSPIFNLAMALCALLALGYWLLFLRCLPPSRIRVTTPPPGISAGEVVSRLLGTGADLSLMVVSWADLGYLYMNRDDAGRVILHKRMSMGNERSAFENRIFRSLFPGRRVEVDGTGYHYAALCRKVAGDRSCNAGQYVKNSGNPTLFRVLCAAMGLCFGVGIGYELGWSEAWRLALMIVLGAGAAVWAWVIQSGCRCVYQRHKGTAIAGAVLSVLWIGLGIFAGNPAGAVLGVLCQILGGFAAACGGRRTEAAQETLGAILGLRHYLKTVDRKEFQKILAVNPEHYYHLAPYALALGVDKAFATRLGRTKLPGCAYLVTGGNPHNALRWYPLLRSAVDTLDEGQKRLRRERFLKF